MTIDAEIIVLFASPPDPGSLPGLVGFSLIDDADLHCWVSPAGRFEFQSAPRSAPLPGETSLEGRLWRGVLGRHWTPDNPNYGGAPRTYANVLRSVGRLPDVEYVWYGVLTADSGCCDIPPVTDDWISRYFGSDSEL